MPAFSLILISYAPFSIYSIWYDSAALFFLLMGALLISGADLSDQKGKGAAFKYLAGICHACMVYAYPTMAAVIIVLIVYKTVCLIRKKVKVKQFLIYWLPYLLGGMTIAGIFAIYVLNVGWENIFLFQHKSVDDALSGRTLDKISTAGKEAEKASALAPLILQLKSILGQIGSILLSAWNQQKLALAVSIPLLVQWIIGRKKKERSVFYYYLKLWSWQESAIRVQGSGQRRPCTHTIFYGRLSCMLILKKRKRKNGERLLCCLQS